MKKFVVIIFSTLLTACSLQLHKPLANGTYQGILPCADCEKIEAELKLHSDNTYIYNTVYFKRGKTYPFSESGTFVRNATKEDVIHLTNSDNLTLKLSNTHVEICDKDGNLTESKLNYKLKKIK